MANSKLSGLSIGLLVLTLISWLITAYSLLPDSPAPKSNSRTQAAAHDADSDEYSRTEQNPPRDGKGTSNTGSSGGSREDEIPSSAPRPDKKPGTASNDGASGKTEGDNGVVAADSSGRISGTVLDSAGKPVSGARVTARRSDMGVESRRRGDFAEELDDLERKLQKLRASQREADTDGEGRFTVVGLDAARAYDLSAKADALGSGMISRVACGDNVVIILGRDCTLSGQVLIEGKRPLCRYVLQWRRADMPSQSRAEVVQSEDGRYTANVRPGLHTVWVEVEDLLQSPRQEIDVPAGGAELNFSLTGIASLSGTVTDSQKKPIPDATVRLTLDEDANAPSDEMEGMQRGRTDSVRTDSLGRYTFEAVSPGRYTARASLSERHDSKEVSLVAGENKHDFAIAVGAKVTLRFKGTQSEPPTEPSASFARKKGGSVRPLALAPREPGVRVYIGVEPGDYTVTYSARGYASSTQEMKISDGENEFTLELAVAAYIHGEISGCGPARGVRVQITAEGEKRSTSANAQADGTYRCGPLACGKYTIEVVARGRTPVFSQSVSLGAGDNTLNIVVKDAAALKVVVTHNGQPAANAQISAQFGKELYAVSTDERGVARLTYIPIGDYLLTAHHGNRRSIQKRTTLGSGENEVALDLKDINCVQVTRVDKNSEAEKAGILANDIIFSYNLRDVAGRKSLDQLIAETKGIESVTLTLERNGQVHTLNIKGGAFGGAYQDAVR